MIDKELMESIRIEAIRTWLARKSLEELYRSRGEQYGSKRALVEDIIAHDDGCLEERMEHEESQLFILAGRMHLPFRE